MVNKQLCKMPVERGKESEVHAEVRDERDLNSGYICCMICSGEQSFRLPVGEVSVPSLHPCLKVEWYFFDREKIS